MTLRDAYKRLNGNVLQSRFTGARKKVFLRKRQLMQKAPYPKPLIQIPDWPRSSHIFLYLLYLVETSFLNFIFNNIPNLINSCLPSIRVGNVYTFLDFFRRLFIDGLIDQIYKLIFTFSNMNHIFKGSNVF